MYTFLVATSNRHYGRPDHYIFILSFFLFFLA